MTYKLRDVPIEQLAIEHYLFDLDQPVEKTAEILGEDEKYVRKVHDNYMRLTMPAKGNK